MQVVVAINPEVIGWVGRRAVVVPVAGINKQRVSPDVAGLPIQRGARLFVSRGLAALHVVVADGQGGEIRQSDLRPFNCDVIPEDIVDESRRSSLAEDAAAP